MIKSTCNLLGIKELSELNGWRHWLLAFTPKAIDNLLTVESVFPRIMVLELGGNPKTSIVCV